MPMIGPRACAINTGPNSPHPTIKRDALGLVQASPDRADLLALAKAIAEGEVSTEFKAEVGLLEQMSLHPPTDQPWATSRLSPPG
jgi:hypothetical protein